ncbi:Cro/CI family transcriptional regulator [Acinetobacter guillouiae]|uniref:Cro/CI family transcriptional regulator n=1 Tax=Acinetobacter guillouiae TaxID=106649 RepID=UPI00333E74BA
METIPLTTLVEKHGREEVAEMVGCHLTNINHVITNDREVYVVLGENQQVMHCFEVRKFPNRKIAKAKKQKTSAVQG